MWEVDRAAKAVSQALPSMPTVLPPYKDKKKKKKKKKAGEPDDEKPDSPTASPVKEASEALGQTGVVVQDRRPPYPYMMSESEDEDYSDDDEKRLDRRKVELTAWGRYLNGKD